MVQQPPGGAQPPQPPPPPPGQPPQAPVGPPRAQFDTSQLPIADIIVAGGAFLAFIFTFTPWYRVEYLGFGGPSGRGGWQTLPTIIYILLALFAGFFVVNAYANIVDIELPLGVIYLIWAIVGIVAVLLGFVIRPGGGWEFVKVNWVWWIISIILGVAPVVGGYMKMQEA